MILRCSFLFLALLPPVVCAQTFERQIDPFPVISGGVVVETPFLGGFNQPVPQFVDWDRDGLLDLFVLDQDGRLQFYRNGGSPGEPQFQLDTKWFQKLDVGRWYRFVDHDLDGDPDLLCQTPGSSAVSVYRNSDDMFELATDRLVTDDGALVSGGQIVIPTLADIDGDGWPDLFVGSLAGTVTHYSNLGLKDHLPLFHLESETFQDISIVWVPGRGDRHGANALEFYDIDADNDFDLFWGDLFQPGLFFLENVGTRDTPDIRDSLMVVTYPQSRPVATAGFNVPRFADVDSDGDGDLFIGVQSGAYGTDYTNNFWHYENVGMESFADFEFKTVNAITTLDIIASSIPALADIDNDGDDDLFVGNEFDPQNPGWKGTVTFFRNSGTAYEPSFSLEDSSFFDIPIGNNLSPDFTDIDCDGDLDAFVGDWNGKIHLLENNGSVDFHQFDYAGEVSGIDLSGRASPVFADWDGDGDTDLLIGDKNGAIHVWISPERCSALDRFVVSSDDAFPEVDLGSNVILSSSDIDRDGNEDLIVGNEAGELFFIFHEGAGEWEIEKVDSFPYSGLNLAPIMSDLDSDGNSELIAGSRAGGLQFFRVYDTQVNVDRAIKPSVFTVRGNYPNPFNGTTTFRFDLTRPGRVELIIYDVAGREVVQLHAGEMNRGQHHITWDAKGMSSGLYFYSITVRESSSTIQRLRQRGKMILLK